MTCRACHEEHSPLLNCGVARRQREAAERAKESAPAVAEVAINKARERGVAINRRAINKVVDERTPNRRARAAYNEYMRGYMARRRASGSVA